MATAYELISDALKELTVIGEEQQASSVAITTGIRYLNRMMQALDADGVKLGYTLVTKSNQQVTIPSGAYEGIVCMLAVRLAPSYDLPISAELASNAREGKKIVYKLGVSVKKSNFPSSLPIGSGNEGAGDTFLGDAFFPGCCEDEDTCGE